MTVGTPKRNRVKTATNSVLSLWKPSKQRRLVNYITLLENHVLKKTFQAWRNTTRAIIALRNRCAVNDLRHKLLRWRVNFVCFWILIVKDYANEKKNEFDRARYVGLKQSFKLQVEYFIVICFFSLT